MSLQEQIQQEIQDTIPQMIDDAIGNHTHNGTDSLQIQGQYLSQAPQPSVTLPSGGLVVDIEARQSIADIVSRLQQLGLIN